MQVLKTAPLTHYPRSHMYLGVKPPVACQIGQEPIKDVFIDGATRNGQWAYMCLECHKIHGVGLGIGRGQKYVRQSDNKWLKVNK